MSPHEHDDLWQLLGKGRKPVVSPFLARNVVREVRSLKQDALIPKWVLTVARCWQIPALGACAMLVAGITCFYAERPAHDEVAPAEDAQILAMVATVSQGPDYRVIGHLDELMESEQNSVWLSGER